MVGLLGIGSQPHNQNMMAAGRAISALIAWSLYPVVIAGVFSITFGLLNQMLAAVGDPSDMQNIGAALPFLAMIMLSLALIAGIPVIVRTISGDINSGFAAVATGAIMRGAYQRVTPSPNSGRTARSAPREVTQAPRQPDIHNNRAPDYVQQLERVRRLRVEPDGTETLLGYRDT